MSRTTNIPSRVRTAVSDDHMEALATRIMTLGGLIAGFTDEEYGSHEAAQKKAKGYQIRWGTFKARARKRTYEFQRSMGHEINTLSYEGPYDQIEAQVHECHDRYEVRFILSKDLYKEITLTDLNGSPIEL